METRFKMWMTGVPDILKAYFNGTWWIWIGPNHPGRHACPMFRWTRTQPTHYDLDKYTWIVKPEMAGRNISERVIGDPEELMVQWGWEEVRLDPYSEYSYLARISEEMKINRETVTEELGAILEKALQQCEIASEVLSRNIDRKAQAAKERLGL